MVQYPHELLNGLRHQKNTIEMYGTQIEIKAIPDEPRPGRLDPRERASAEEYRRQTEAGKIKPESEMTLEEQRLEMGFPGWNMNTVAIHTRYEEIGCSGRKVGIWVYYPRLPVGRQGRAGLVYLHGGGWIGGAPFDLEGGCRLVAQLADCVVFNIDYALAPEHPYPAGLDDCFAAIRHIHQNAARFGVDPEKLAVGGDSAGGNLAALCALRDRDEGGRLLKKQFLLYPVVTFNGEGVGDYRWSAEDYDVCDEDREIILDSLDLGHPSEEGKPSMGRIEGYYLQHGEDPKGPAVSPMFADPPGLCPAVIVGAEFDGLRVQDEYYGRLLREAGVPVRILRYCGMRHGFFEKLGLVPQAEDLAHEIAQEMKAL